MNGVGYALLRKDALSEAISALELNVDAHPESANVYDSLGEAYMTAGRDNEALASYEKSLALDPKNDDATRRIQWIHDGIEARKRPVSMSTATLQKFAGRYGRVLIELEEDSLFASGDLLNGKYRLVPFAEDTFSLEGRSVYRVRFVPDESGRITRVVAWNVYGNQYEAERDSATQ